MIYTRYMLQVDTETFKGSLEFIPAESYPRYSSLLSPVMSMFIISSLVCELL